MLDFSRALSAKSVPSYLAWRVLKKQNPVVLRFRSGVRIELRPGASENNDYGVAYEVFVHDFYSDGKRLNQNSVRLVVDLGANVGYSVLYFLHKYPVCKVIAFEPHANHAKQALRNLLIDGTNERVEFHAVAAGAKTRSLHITNQKSSSTLHENASDETIPVRIVDIFPILGDRHIDILKMDIEGGEYEILADERFAKLKVSTIVMEWHSRGNGLTDKHWCEERLRSLGFDITEIFTEQGHGMFWAHRVNS